MPRAAKNPVTGVTPQQEEWCLQCIRLGDPNKAYRMAYKAEGMAQSSVRAAVSRLLDNAALTHRLAHYQGLADQKLGVSIERIAKELARIGFSDPAELCDDEGNFLPLHMLPEDVRRAVQSVKVLEKKGGPGIGVKKGEKGAASVTGVKHVPLQTREIRMWPKHEALVTMAKWKRMLVEQVESGAPGDFVRLSNDELEKHIAAEDAALAAINSAKLRAKVTAAKKSAKAT